MRHRIPAAAITTTAAILALAACGPVDTVNTQPDKTTAASSAPKTSAPKTPAKIGDSITLKGQEPGQQVTVTLKQWSGSIKSSNDFETPQDGKQWVAGQFQLQNTGSATYSDSPDNCAQAADAQGQRYQTTMVQDITNGPIMTSDLKMAPGDKALGWIVFEVPQGTKVTTVQFTLNSGFGGETGQWTVK